MNPGVNRLQQRYSAADVSGPQAIGADEEPSAFSNVFDGPLSLAIERTRDWLLQQQHPDGFWVGELEGDTILESEYALLLAYLGREESGVVRDLARHILNKQLPDGGWSLFPGGPLEVSGSVKAYWALKIAGHDPDAEYMQRARAAILAAGGAEHVNSFTRYYMALLGAISYRQCPAVPPELMLLPVWAPFNIYEMSAWSRTILVPLSLLWAFQPSRRLPDRYQIRELFHTSPEALPVTMPRSASLDAMKRRAWLPWDGVFRWIDRGWKGLEWLRIKPLRRRSIRLAADWMIERLADSDGLGAIFPPIIWSVVALKCLGHADDSPLVTTALRELEHLYRRDDDGALRLQPCKSAVWDTAITLVALREAEVPAGDPQVRRGVEWLLSKEVRGRGDWSVRNPDVQPGGWFFEFNNAFYPDVDDTIMVTMALAACLPGECHRLWTAALVPTGPQGHTNAAELAAVVAGRTDFPEQARQDIDQMQPMLAAIGRAVYWVLGMQCRGGGWGAFDRDNDRELLTRVPFADHNAMIDPPTADITARTLEMFGRLGVDRDHPAICRALQFVWQEQEPDHCWYGRWGVHYLYGTWQVLVGLREVCVPVSDPRLQAASRWLKDQQQASGGWGETALSYDQPLLRGAGPPTASQTAWALMGLMAAGEVHSPAVRRGVDYLLGTQRSDGTWDEDQFTGTGFPRVFYLKYHYYRIYFPLMALARYSRLRNQPSD